MVGRKGKSSQSLPYDRPLFQALVSAIVLVYDQICYGIGWLVGRRMPAGCVVINYHAVPDNFAERFRGQMRTLVKLAKPISAVKNRDLLPGWLYITVTFDDAFCSFARNAWPVLKELRIPVTVFVPTSYLGCQSAWVDYGGDNPVGEDVICAKALLDIAADELVDVGSHTATHADLVSLSDEGVRQELNSSRQALETMLGRTIDSISFPYGSCSDREIPAGQRGWISLPILSDAPKIAVCVS